MIVITSISNVTRLLPVPVTAFNHIVENDINSMAKVTTRTTGMACCVKPAVCTKTDSRICGKRLMRVQITRDTAELILMIFKIRECTLSCLPWPIILLTMAAPVAANDQVMHPMSPKMLRMIFEIASASWP